MGQSSPTMQNRYCWLVLVQKDVAVIYVFPFSHDHKSMSDAVQWEHWQHVWGMQRDYSEISQHGGL